MLHEDVSTIALLDRPKGDTPGLLEISTKYSCPNISGALSS